MLVRKLTVHSNATKLTFLQVYIDLLKSAFLPWYRSKSVVGFKRKLIWMQDDAPSHASRQAKGFLAREGSKDDRITDWPPHSPDLNRIDPYCGILKHEVYSNGKQFHTFDDLWSAIQVAGTKITKDQILKLTTFADHRLELIFVKEGRYNEK